MPSSHISVYLSPVLSDLGKKNPGGNDVLGRKLALSGIK